MPQQCIRRRGGRKWRPILPGRQVGFDLQGSERVYFAEAVGLQLFGIRRNDLLRFHGYSHFTEECSPGMVQKQGVIEMLKPIGSSAVRQVLPELTGRTLGYRVNEAAGSVW